MQKSIAGQPVTSLQPMRAVLATVLAGGCALATSSVQAADYATTLQALQQQEFRSLSEELGAGIAYKGMAPAESLGVLGFDISASATAMQLKDRTLWSNASNGAKVDRRLAMGGIRVHKGLPYNIDVEGFYNKASNNIGVYGGGLRWAVLPGSTLVPAVALRGSFSRLNGVDQLKAQTAGVDVSISKGFLMFTPYAGLGRVWVRSTPQNVGGLQKESFALNRSFVGLNVNLGINLAAEVDRTGDVTSYSVKAGIRF